MDLQLANTLYSKFKKTQQKEEFEDNTSTTVTTSKPVDAPVTIVNTNTKPTINSIYWQIFSLLIGIFAAYLSWSCNTAKGIDTVPKVIYSIFAFFFGTLYLIYYAMFRAGRCYPKQVIYTPYQYPPQYPQNVGYPQQYPPQYPPQVKYAPQSTNVGGKKGISKN